MANEEMSEAMLAVVADRFRALSDTMRLRILQQLRDSEKTVNELVTLTGSSQPNISKHLSTLRNHGLVRRRQEGNLAYFSLASPMVFQLCDIVCDGMREELTSKQALLGS
jgi:DNA-binding transcriptional ArsR family regulator